MFHIFRRKKIAPEEEVLAAVGIEVEPFTTESLHDVYLTYRGMVLKTPHTVPEKPIALEGGANPFCAYSTLGDWSAGTPCTYHLGGRRPEHFAPDPALLALKECWDERRKERERELAEAATPKRMISGKEDKAEGRRVQ